MTACEPVFIDADGGALAPGGDAGAPGAVAEGAGETDCDGSAAAPDEPGSGDAVGEDIGLQEAIRPGFAG